MAKRTATSDLNHDNWDRDDEPEESGTFAKASEDVIKKRVIRVAKRRNPISSNDEEKTNAFGGFTAFSKVTPPTSNAFNFLSNLTNKSEEPKTNGTINETTKSTTTSTVTTIETNKNIYYAKLKGLNESVSKWISKHVTENPLVNLQPIFKDYDKYFAELEQLNENEKKEEVGGGGGSKPEFSFGVPTSSSINNNTTNNKNSSTTIPKFNFGSSSIPKFSFGTESSSSTTPNFSFGTKPSSTDKSFVSNSFANATTSTFTISGSSASSFGEKTALFSTSFGGASSTNTAAAATTTNKDNDANVDNEEGNDEPPKVEFTPVVEEGHVYTIRCKVFVKKDGSFGDRGVGNLYLKPVPNSEKIQLIVRADTNLGNLLCNFILSKGLPMQRMGKKDVMVVCIPTPDCTPPPVPILLRVKSTEDADDLLKTLQKYQK